MRIKYLLTFAMTYTTVQFLVRFLNGFDNCKLTRKTQEHFGEKTQNSAKFRKTLKPKSKKTQKPLTPVEMSCPKTVQSKPLPMNFTEMQNLF